MMAILIINGMIFNLKIQLLMSIYFLIRVSGLFILSLNEIYRKKVFVYSAPNSLIGSEWFLLQPFNIIKTGMKMENVMQHSKSIINNNISINYWVIKVIK